MVWPFVAESAVVQPGNIERRNLQHGRNRKGKQRRPRAKPGEPLRQVRSNAARRMIDRLAEPKALDSSDVLGPFFMYLRGWPARKSRSSFFVRSDNHDVLSSGTDLPGRGCKLSVVLSFCAPASRSSRLGEAEASTNRGREAAVIRLSGQQSPPRSAAGPF